MLSLWCSIISCLAIPVLLQYASILSEKRRLNEPVVALNPIFFMTAFSFWTVHSNGLVFAFTELSRVWAKVPGASA